MEKNDSLKEKLFSMYYFPMDCRKIMLSERNLGDKVGGGVANEPQLSGFSNQL